MIQRNKTKPDKSHDFTCDWWLNTYAPVPTFNTFKFQNNTGHCGSTISTTHTHMSSYPHPHLIPLSTFLFPPFPCPYLCFAWLPLNSIASLISTFHSLPSLSLSCFLFLTYRLFLFPIPTLPRFSDWQTVSLISDVANMCTCAN